MVAAWHRLLARALPPDLYVGAATRRSLAQRLAADALALSAPKMLAAPPSGRALPTGVARCYTESE